MADVPLMNNPMTTAGDIVQGGASGVPARLGIGSAGDVLKVNAGATALEYGAASAGGGEFTETSRVVLTTGNLATSSSTFSDATGLTITITTAAVRCIVTFTATGNISTTGQLDVDLVIDGTRVAASHTHGLAFLGGGASVFGSVGFFYLTDVLSAASHTFKIQFRATAGTGTIYAATTHSPAILTVLETLQAT